MKTLWQDLRYGFRMMRKSPGFTAVAVLTLALGIGANTALFSIINAVLLRPFPYKDPDRLVTAWNKMPQAGYPLMILSAPEFIDYRDQNEVFESMAAYRDQSFNLTGGPQPERIPGARVTASFFPTLGVGASLGRTFVPEEDQPGNDHVVVLSHGLWQRAFGGDPSLVGRTIKLNGESYTVVGIMPSYFHFLASNVELWRPMAFSAQETNGHDMKARGTHIYLAFARLKPGVTMQQAQAAMETIARRLQEKYPTNYPASSGWGATVTPLREMVVGNIRPSLLVLLAAVVFVLLIACANLSNLLLAQGATREREMAVRAAVGASRSQLVRQLLTESVLLAVLGGAFGLLLALWGIDLLVALRLGGIPRIGEVKVDRPVLTFTLLISVSTAILFGILPALQASKPDLNESLKEGGRTSSSFSGNRTRGLLVVSEVALAVLLLIGAGLLIKSYFRLQQVNPGFDPRNVLTMHLSLPESKHREDHQVKRFYQQLLERVRALPGVRAAGLIEALPFVGDSTGAVTIEGQVLAPGDLSPEVDQFVISPHYFRAMNIPLLRGRDFSEQDNEQATGVAIVDETLARLVSPNGDAIGKRVKMAPPQIEAPWLTIVGIVGQVKDRRLDAASRMQFYIPHAQLTSSRMPFYGRTMALVVRTVGNPLMMSGSVREQVHAIDKDQPVFFVRSMEQIVSTSLAQRRLSMFLLGLFAVIALVLASVGIYGVMAYSVSQRTHEIGVRMALGAQHRDVLKLILQQGLTLALAGLSIGLATAFALTRALSSLLYGISATDPATFISIGLLLTAVALVACYLPARRAAKVDPMVALRYE